MSTDTVASMLMTAGRGNSIYIKQEKWEKALRAAEAAKRLHRSAALRPGRISQDF